ncbi:MAG: hypothetical protein AB7S26_36330 [Sandaracinaceae bacterium]
MPEWRLEREVGGPLYPVAGGNLTLVMGGGSRASITVQETNPGELVEDAVFRVLPLAGLRPGQEPGRIIIQVRRGVTLRVRSVDRPDMTQDAPDNVAVAAVTDRRWATPHANRAEPVAYAWVQTVFYPPEQVRYVDGRSETTALELRRIGSRPQFQDRGETWFVDNRGDLSARYAVGGAHSSPVSDPGGEIIYDLPDLSLSYGAPLSARTDIREVDSTTLFRTYLYERPGGYRGIASQDALALVEWEHRERWERSPRGEARRTEVSMRLRRIEPNPIEPLELDAAIGTYRFG